MKLAKFTDGKRQSVGILDGDSLRLLQLNEEIANLTDILEAADPEQTASSLAGDPMPLADVKLLAPIDQQEVWAAGVTYKRSKAARMEESEAAASCYDRVYVADRPELFMKATPHRVVGPGDAIRIRTDSKWNVPEPELGLVINSRKQLVGFTIGDDVSSRDIEGENPLYLPQAKVYDQCCSLGPCITLASGMPATDAIGISLQVKREGNTVFEGRTSTSQLARSFDDLIGWLGRDNSFPGGAILLTGTGIVPDSDFTLLPDDIVDISIDGIGTLSTPVIQG